MQRLVIFTYAVFLILGLVSAQYSFTVPTSCSSSQYFDTTGYQCLSCPANSISYSASTWVSNPKLSFPTSSVSSLSPIQLLNRGLSSQDPVCICSAGYFIDASVATPTCSACAANTVAYSDQSACIACDGTTSTYDATLGDCKCVDSSHVLVETSGNTYATTKSCQACPANAMLDPTNRYNCVFCPDHRMTLTGAGVGMDRCVCPTGFSEAGGECVLTTSVSAIQIAYQPTQWPRITYRDIQTTDSSSSSTVTVSSATVSGLFLNAAAKCKYEKDMMSCQTVANLCVLAMYEISQEMCRFYRDTSVSISAISWGFSDWRSGMPWLYYSSATQAITSTNIEANVALNGGTVEGATQSVLQYKLAKYSLNGTLLATETLTTQLQLCPANLITGLKYLHFGTAYDNDCEIELVNLMTDQPVFYELYFSDSGAKWYPVPVKVLNLRENGNLMNKENGKESFNEDTLRLTRRFFLSESFTSRTTLTSSPQYLVYAKKVTLRVSMMGGSLQKIYPPMLVVDYATRRVDLFSTGTDLNKLSSIAFNQEYEKSIGKVETAAIVIFFLVLAVVLFAWVVKVCVWRARDGPGEISMGTVVNAFVLLLGIIGELMFWIVFGTTAVLFLFFKGQEAVHVLLPSPSSIVTKAFGPFLVIAFVFILFQVLAVLAYQVSVDVVFIDWETPPPSLHPSMKQSNGVSVWRKIFVANKWLDLQLSRTHNVPLSLCFLIFLLQGLSLEALATGQPDGTNLSMDAAPINSMLRCFITAMFFLIIAGIQRLFQFLIMDCVRVKRTDEFVDLLSSTNISCLLFDHDLHMFYLHGKSVHSRADATSAEFNIQLLHERKNWVKSRGLINEQACFSVFATPELRLAYDDQFSAARNRHLVHEQEVGAGISTNLNRDRSQVATPVSLLVADELQRAETALNSFLTDFVDKTTMKHKWELSSRGAVSSWLDMPGRRAQSSEHTSLFCEDHRRHFQRLLLSGEEHILLMLYTSALVMFEWAIGNTLAAVFIVYLLDLSIMLFRKRFGRINTAKKTLIDEKFLMQQY